MSSVGPSIPIVPVPRPSVAARVQRTVVEISSSLSSIFKEMIMLAVAVVVAAAFVMLCVASPTYYDMKLTRVPWVGNHTSMTPPQDHDDGHSERVRLGLYYYSYWRVYLWGVSMFQVIRSVLRYHFLIRSLVSLTKETW